MYLYVSTITTFDLMLFLMAQQLTGLFPSEIPDILSALVT